MRSYWLYDVKLRGIGLRLLLVAAVLTGLLGASSPALALEPGQHGKITFVSSRDGNNDIYVMNADGSEQTNLANNAADDLTPTWSPDGSKIAFASDRDGNYAIDGNYEIYVMDADGSQQTRLISSPGLDAWPTWSPDGSKIAFMSERDGDSEIYVMNADGSEQTRLTSTTGWDTTPAWSPDGSKIAFMSHRAGREAIYVMNADGSQQTRLTSSAGRNPAWSPDGSKIAFASECTLYYCEIHVMNADGSEQTRLTSNVGRDTDPAWSPDGSKIAFTRQRDRSTIHQIYVMNTDGSEQTQLTNTIRSNGMPDWQSITPSNAPPHIGSFTAPTDPVAVGTAVGIVGSFTDADAGDVHSALIEWGDGTASPGTVTKSNGSGSVSGSHTYAAAGVYTLELTVTDGHGASDSEIYAYVVLYDPAAGFVTGNGLINSPAGAYAADPSVSGKAHFGFVSRYEKGATRPSGRTLFQFQTGNLDFRSSAYEWLVISGPKAQYKGEGAINGSGAYGFMLTAQDEQVSGGGGVDRFRIKIWEKSTGNVVYDNQMGDTLDAPAHAAIESGSIIIHRK